MFSPIGSTPQKRKWLRSPSTASSFSGLFSPKSIEGGRRSVLSTSSLSSGDFQREDDDVESFADVDARELHMAVCVAMGRIGAAYYDASSGRINILEDVVESYISCDVLKALITQVQPTNLIAASKQDEKVMHHLKTLCIAPASTLVADPELSNKLNQNINKPRLTLLRAWDFGFTTCKQRICTVVGQNAKHVGSMHDEMVNKPTEETVETESRLRAAFAVNFDASCMVRSFGALLKFLNLKRLGKTHLLDGNLSNDSGSLNYSADGEAINSEGIYCVRKFTLEKTLMMDVPSFEALQIFQQQYHPSVYKAGRAGMKEGLSLFNLCNQCRSGPGAMELRRWFLRPMTDLDALRKRLDAIQYLADDNNDELVDAMSRTLQNVRHLASILTRMRMGKITIRDWTGLYKTIYHCCRLGELLRIRHKRPALLTELAESFGEVLYETRTMISQIVDFEASRKENRFVVQRNVDEELDARKDFLTRLPEFMTMVANEEMLMLDLSAEESNIVYYPLLGYLLKLPQPSDCMSETGSLLERDGLELRFAAEGMAYYKSEATRRMDVEFGDVQFKIIDRETSIMLNLQQAILEQAGDLLDAVQAAAQVDCLISLALAARTFNWTKPNLVEENVINVVDARHPLQEVVSANEQFVPNPIQSGGFGERQYHQRPVSDGLTPIRQLPSAITPFPKIHLLTGPNASGKSVYMKQVGLIAYLAHVGSFVPAKKAEIGILDGIFTRLRTLDSVTGGMSSFAIDLRQMSVALKHATGKSLVLIDEFGKGTSTETGAGLFAASLEYWLEMVDDGCPHVYACSHLYSLVDSLPESPLIEHKTMNILRNGDQFIFLYKLIDGTIESSLAAHTARAAGLPISLVERSVEVFNNIKAGLQTHRPDMTDEEYQAQCEKMTRLGDKFMALDLDDPERPLQEILQEYVDEFENGDPSIEEIENDDA